MIARSLLEPESHGISNGEAQGLALLVDTQAPDAVVSSISCLDGTKEMPSGMKQQEPGIHHLTRSQRKNSYRALTDRLGAGTRQHCRQWS